MRTIFLKIYLFIAILGISLFSAQSGYTEKQIDSLITSNSKPNDWDLKKNIDFLNDLYKESEKIRYEKGMYRSFTRITDWYLQKAEYKSAFPYFEKIENLPVRDPQNYLYKIKALQNKAYAFINLGLFDDAQIAIKKSVHLCNKIDGDEKYTRLGTAFDYNGALYIEMKKPEDSVLFFYKKAALQYKRVKNEQQRNILLNKTYINISTSFFEAKKLDSAMYYSHKVLKNKYLSDEGYVFVVQTIGQIHREKNDMDSAFYYYKNAETASAKLKGTMALKGIYQTLSEMYSKAGDKDNALVYTKKYADLSDSLNIANKESAAIANKSIKKELMLENASKRKYLYWIIGGSLILLLFISWYLVKKYHREKKAVLEKREILEQKDKELYELKSRRVNDSFEEVVLLAKNNDPVFLGRFKDLYPDFCNRLQQVCPDILNSELTFCAYLKLNFSTKEIAAYTFTEPRSVQNRKGRLRKRLNIPSDEDIYIWIGKI